MAGRATLWRAAAAIFTVINVAGAIYAGLTGEIMHAGVHVALIVGTYGIWQASRERGDTREVTSVPALDSRLEQLQYSVDAVALEVERIGEAQRFINKVQQDRAADRVRDS